MKIGYVTTTIESANGGWGRYSKSLIETMGPGNNAVVLTESFANNDPIDPSIKVVKVLPSHHSSNVTQQIRIFISCVRYLGGCQVIHCLTEPFAPGLALYCFLTRKKFVITLHGTYSNPEALGRAMRFLMYYALKFASILTTGSFNTEEKAREFFKFNECRFIPNGVDEKVFKHMPELTKQRFMLTVGAVKERKGADVGIDALALLKDEFPDLIYKIVGSKGKDSFITILNEKIKQHNLGNRVEFVDNVNDTELVKLYNQAMVFILAARDDHGHFEGFPMVFYEANICGTPVISTVGFGSEYAIKNDESGFVVSPNNPKEVADKVRSLLRDSALYSKLVQGALREGNLHIWANIRPQLELFYADAFKPSKKP